jgi:hypothetical protein
MLRQVLMGRAPLSTKLKHGSNQRQNRVRLGSAQDVAAAFNGLGALCDVAQRNIANTEYSTLLLDGSAITEDTAGILLQCDKIKKTEWFSEANIPVLYANSVLFHSFSSAGMGTNNYRTSILSTDQPKRFGIICKTPLDIHIFGTMERNQKIAARLDL